MALPSGSVADIVQSEINSAMSPAWKAFLLEIKLRLHGENLPEGFADGLGSGDDLSRLRYQGRVRFVECQDGLQVVGAEGIGEQSLHLCEYCDHGARDDSPCRSDPKKRGLRAF